MTTGPLCKGCPLQTRGSGFARVDGSGSNKILLVGEALGREEALAGKPFVGGAGKLLDRILSRVIDPETNQALRREDFLIANIVSCRPPDNNLTGAPWESDAISHCKPYLEETIRTRRPSVVVAMGNQAFRWFTGEWGIDRLRGYVFKHMGLPVVGTYHPAYIMRGKFPLARVFQLDILKALYVSRHGVPQLAKTYITNPSAGDAQAYAARYFSSGRPPLAFDIETPYARIEKDEDIGAEPNIEDDLSYRVILRISFSFEDGVAISMPWSEPFIGIAKALLASRGDKIVWNRHFDVPRLTANGAPVSGRVYDGMDAFHFLEPSLPMGLKYAATFYCPDMPPWKLMSQSDPEWYSAADSDVARRVFMAVKAALMAAERWVTFERHYVDLGLILQSLTQRGVGVDQKQRVAERERFRGEYEKIVSSLQPLIPLSLRPKQVFKLDENRLRKEGKWVEGKMVKVSESLTSVELARMKLKSERDLSRAKAKAEKLRARELKAAARAAAKALKSSSRNSTKRKRNQTAKSAGGNPV